MQGSISAAILAGGPGTRMKGVVKSNLEVGGEKVLSRILSVIENIFEEIIIVTNKPEEFTDFRNCNIVQDQYTGIGPLGGIHAALKATSSEAVFILAGDMPLLNEVLIRKQIDLFNKMKCDILVPRIGRFIEPLHSVCRSSVLNSLEVFLSSGKGYAVRDFLEKVHAEYMELPDNDDFAVYFSNINYPSDLISVESLVKKGRDSYL